MHLAKIAYQQKYMLQVASSLSKSSLNFSVKCGIKRVPQELKDASIIHLYKKKGNRQSCDNHCGISLLSIAEKILARVLLSRLQSTLKKVYFLRVSVALARAGVQWIRSSLPDNLKKSAMNKK